jgi:hypothetical protein
MRCSARRHSTFVSYLSRFHLRNITYVSNEVGVKCVQVRCESRYLEDATGSLQKAIFGLGSQNLGEDGHAKAEAENGRSCGTMDHPHQIVCFYMQ